MAVSSMLGGQKPPSLYERYPTLFSAPEAVQEAPDDAWMLYKEQMIDFANLHNKNRKRGVNNTNDD